MYTFKVSKSCFVTILHQQRINDLKQCLDQFQHYKKDYFMWFVAMDLSLYSRVESAHN